MVEYNSSNSSIIFKVPLGGLQKDIDFVKEKIKKIEAHKSKNKQDKRAKIELTRMIHLKKKMDAYLLKKQN